MKTGLTAGIKTHAAQSRTNFVTLWKITRTDGVIKGITEYWRDIAFDLGDGDGEITYSSADPYLRSSIRQSATLGVDTMVVEGVTGAVITLNDVIAGKYTGAIVDVFMINYLDHSQGDWPLLYGFFGDFERHGIAYKTELNSLSMLYQNQVVELFSAPCRADLGDIRCKVRLLLSVVPVWLAATAYTARTDFDAATGSLVRDASFPDRYFWCTGGGTSGGSAPSWNTTIGGTTNDNGVIWETIRTGELQETISSVVSRKEFVISGYSGDLDAAYLNLGLVEWLTGNNTGVHRGIKSWDLATKIIVLDRPVRVDISASDTISIRPGCDKSLPVCRDTFGNTHNKRSEDRVPGSKLFIRTPNAH